MKRVIFALTLTAALLGAPSFTNAQEEASAPPKTAAKASAKAKQMPFRGTIGSVDQKAKTITLKGKTKSRTFRVRDDARIKRQGEAIELKAIREGETVGGLARTNEQGQWEVVTLNVGLKTPDAKAKTQDKTADATEDRS